MEIGLFINAIFFFAMGALALVAPTRFIETLGLRCDNRNGRNEIRGVYGGFGVAMSGVCVVALTNSVLRPGLLWGLAAAVFGMVGGRVWSTAVDRGADALMWSAMAVELSLGCVLVAIATGALGTMGFFP